MAAISGSHPIIKIETNTAGTKHLLTDPSPLSTSKKIKLYEGEANNSSSSALLSNKPVTPISSPSNEDEILMNQAHSLYKEKKYTESLSIYKQIIDKVSDIQKQISCYYDIGHCYFHLENFHEAAKNYSTTFNLRKSIPCEDLQKFMYEGGKIILCIIRCCDALKDYAGGIRSAENFLIAYQNKKPLIQNTIDGPFMNLVARFESAYDVLKLKLDQKSQSDTAKSTTELNQQMMSEFFKVEEFSKEELEIELEDTFPLDFFDPNPLIPLPINYQRGAILGAQVDAILRAQERVVMPRPLSLFPFPEG